MELVDLDAESHSITVHIIIVAEAQLYFLLGLPFGCSRALGSHQKGSTHPSTMRPDAWWSAFVIRPQARDPFGEAFLSLGVDGEEAVVKTHPSIPPCYDAQGSAPSPSHRC